MLIDDIKPYIDQVKRREITNRELARILHVHEASVCRALKRLRIHREPPAQKLDTKTLRLARDEHRKHAIETLPVKAAAEVSHCSVRTIYRLKAKYKC